MARPAPGLLADTERVRPQAMTTTLAALEQRGLVTRTPEPPTAAAR